MPNALSGRQLVRHNSKRKHGGFRRRTTPSYSSRPSKLSTDAFYFVKVMESNRQESMNKAVGVGLLEHRRELKRGENGFHVQTMWT